MRDPSFVPDWQMVVHFNAMRRNDRWWFASRCARAAHLPFPLYIYVSRRRCRSHVSVRTARERAVLIDEILRMSVDEIS